MKISTFVPIESLKTCLFDPRHLPLLLLQVMFPSLTLLVQPAHEPLDVALVAETALVLPPRGNVICYVDVAVFAEVFLVCDPVFGHGGGQALVVVGRAAGQAVVTL